ncbi:Hypothetical protein HEAR2968 [Herminiimonas arsenicoxydans]|uniref:Uncharacterized protein n=1 Tax=Herminiimonas arsenicoxydans TaxID=204773 RepID=A4G991_HERAR|nr:Hypothetical protein HEAR2968 [Herminiimonas arsenicoxydans]
MRAVTIMANKALAKRQKLTIRIEPSQQALKPRNYLALAAKQRVAGPHQKSISAQRQVQKRLLKIKLSEPDEQ